MTSRRARPWVWGTAVLASCVALGLSWCILRSPLTLYDGLGPILDSRRSPSLASTFNGALYSDGYWRPLRLTQIKAVVDRSPNDPIRAFKTIHVVLVGAMFLLFAAWLRPHSMPEFTAAAIALMIPAGHQAFFGLYSEAYPINHFLEIVVLSLLVAALARGAPRWWKDVAAPLVVAVGSLTLESGLLIGVAAIVCWSVGWRGVSWRGGTAILAIFAAYFYIRFIVLEIPAPGLDERATGWWLTRLEPDDIVRRFSANPLPFYAYNVMSGFAGALLSEPRSGMFAFVARLSNGDVPAWMMIQIVASLLISGAMLVALIPALVRWRRGALDDRDRFLLLAFGMLAANAAIGFGYVKDEVLSVGVAFYAAGAFAVFSRVSERAAAGAAGAAVLLLCTSGLWTIRTADTFFSLQRSAYNVANDWALYTLAQELPRDWEYEPTRRLFFDLQRKNVSREVPHPEFTKQAYVDEYLEVD